MELDELDRAANTWRIRVRLADHPGQLAMLAARLSQRECNLLGVSVLPVADEPDGLGGTGAVVDELVLRAPAQLRRGELAALMESSGVRCVGIVPASVADLVDAQTALLRSASTALATDGAVLEPLRQVLGADFVRPMPEADEPDPVVRSEVRSEARHVRPRRRGHEAVITLAGGGQLLASREWAPFTEGELARVPALLELFDLATRPTVAGPDASRAEREPHAPSQPRRQRRQLSAFDAQFLNAETARTPTHIGVMTLLDPVSAPGGRVTVESVRSLIAGRLHLVDALRWKLHSVPLGMDLPYWVDAGELDLTQHVQQVHLPGPGTDAQLGEEVARLAAEPLARDRPLWESYLINGLTGDRQALYTKVHHAVVDGVSGAEVIAVIFDLAAQPRAVDPPAHPLAPEPPPALTEMAQRAISRSLRLPLRLARSAPATLPNLLALARSSRTPRTPFNNPLTAKRSFAFTSLSLAEVKHVKNELGFTVNDVVMALCTTALRSWLVDHGALPTDPVVAAIPVSVRTAEQFGTAGNQISFMLAELPTDECDPAARLTKLSTSMSTTKKRFLSAPPRLLHDGSELIPQFLHGLASRVLLKAATLGAPPFNLFVSNVPGPQLPLYAAGARVVGNYPVSVVSDIGGGLNITVMSYDGKLDFGLIACSDAVPDVWDLAEHLHCALLELTELAGATRAPVALEG